LKIEPLDESGAYRIGIMNSAEGEEQQRAYFDLTRFGTRAFARTVLDFLTYEQMATQLAAVKESNDVGL